MRTRTLLTHHTKHKRHHLIMPLLLLQPLHPRPHLRIPLINFDKLLVLRQRPQFSVSRQISNRNLFSSQKRRSLKEILLQITDGGFIQFFAFFLARKVGAHFEDTGDVFVEKEGDAWGGGGRREGK